VPPALSDDEFLICDNIIPGFSLSAKRWCFFQLDRIQEFKYNTDAFKSLVLAKEQKSMIHSLVRIHADERLQIDDLIEGKGKGMIFLLHGEPGVGKTLTAGMCIVMGYYGDVPANGYLESIADYTKRPLYTVSSGDLGSDPATTERALTDVLELATGWNAIVLIDEADVFLEQRSHHDLQRNGLVSGN
jgi:SpoVK/Ycf46/Vps4 family AAA+-type ATPase